MITNFRNIYIPDAQIRRKFITNISHVHNIASQTMGKAYFETFQSLRLTNKVIMAPVFWILENEKGIQYFHLQLRLMTRVFDPKEGRDSYDNMRSSNIR